MISHFFKFFLSEFIIGLLSRFRMVTTVNLNYKIAKLRNKVNYIIAYDMLTLKLLPKRILPQVFP